MKLSSRALSLISVAAALVGGGLLAVTSHDDPFLGYPTPPAGCFYYNDPTAHSNADP